MQAYRQWVRDHQPFVYLPKDYHAPRLTPSNYSVFPENKALLHYGIAFTYEEVIEYAIKTKRLQRENLEPSEALAHGYRAATAFVKNLSKQSGVHLELQFPLSLKYRYVAAVCNTNNMFTKPAKKERVTEMERAVKERHGSDHGLRWWWDRDWTHPRYVYSMRALPPSNLHAAMVMSRHKNILASTLATPKERSTTPIQKKQRSKRKA